MSLTKQETLTASELRAIGILQPMRLQLNGELLTDWHNAMARVDADDRVAFDHEPETHWSLEQCLDAGWVFKAHPCIKFWQNCTRSKYSIESATGGMGLFTSASAAINLARVATMIEALRDAGKILASDWLAVTTYDRLKYVARIGNREYTSPLGEKFNAPHSRTVLTGEDSFSFGFQWFNACDPKQIDSDYQLRRQTIEQCPPPEYKHGYYLNDFLQEQKVAVPRDRPVEPCDDLTYRTICKHDGTHNEWVTVNYKFAGFGGIIDRWSRDIWNMEQWSEHHAYSIHT